MSSIVLQRQGTLKWLLLGGSIIWLNMVWVGLLTILFYSQTLHQHLNNGVCVAGGKGEIKRQAEISKRDRETERRERDKEKERER